LIKEYSGERLMESIFQKIKLLKIMD